MSFNNSMAAKKFLVSRIADQAERDHEPLAEVEQKMLYFSENDPTLDDMQDVAAQFDTEINSQQYERKIRHLSARAFQRDRQASRERTVLWREAVARLKKEDHYILEMVKLRPVWFDKVRLVFAALLIVATGIGIMIGLYWLRALYFSRISRGAQWLALIVGVGALLFLAYSQTGRKIGNAFGRAVRSVLGFDEWQ